MLYTRIKVNGHKGEYIAEHAYFGGNPIAAMARFKREYPEMKGLPYTAEVIDDQSEKWREWFRVAVNGR